jgi:hypothetical protein
MKKAIIPIILIGILAVVVVIAKNTAPKKSWSEKADEAFWASVEQDCKREERLNRMGYTIDKIEFEFPTEVAIGDYVFKVDESKSTSWKKFYRCTTEINEDERYLIGGRIESLFKDKSRRVKIEYHYGYYDFYDEHPSGVITIVDKWLKQVAIEKAEQEEKARMDSIYRKVNNMEISVK